MELFSLPRWESFLFFRGGWPGNGQCHRVRRRIKYQRSKSEFWIHDRKIKRRFVRLIKIRVSNVSFQFELLCQCHTWQKGSLDDSGLIVCQWQLACSSRSFQWTQCLIIIINWSSNSSSCCICSIIAVLSFVSFVFHFFIIIIKAARGNAAQTGLPVDARYTMALSSPPPIVFHW